jgi:hypothetical protein
MDCGEGIYCEYCLALSNYLKQLKKEGKEPPEGEYEDVLKHMIDKAWEKESKYYG